MPRGSLEALIKRIAEEENPHRLITMVASDELLLREARRAYDEQKGSPGSRRAVELCRSYLIPYEYFEDRLGLIVHLLNLVPYEESYYQSLGVDRTVSPKEVKRSFRRLSLVYHPDVNPSDPEAHERFRKIRQAYAVLSNDKLRERYDLRLAALNRVDQVLPAQPATGLWRRRRNLQQFGVLIVLLVIVSFLIDYQDLMTSRYYRAKHSGTPSPVEEPIPPTVAAIKAVNISAKDPAAVPDDVTSTESLNTFEPLQTVPVAADEKQIVQTIPASASTLEGPPVPPGQAVSVPENSRPREETAPVRVVSRTSPPAVPSQTAIEPPKAPMTASLEEKQRRPKEPAPSPKPQKDAAAGASDKAVTVSDMKQRIQAFLNRYAHFYENRNLNVLLSLFEPDAIENGEPVASLLPLYHQNFQRSENIVYSIRLVRWEASTGGLRVSSRFRLKIKFHGESPMVTTGAMELDLIHRGDDFRIKRLGYTFKSAGSYPR